MKNIHKGRSPKKSKGASSLGSITGQGSINGSKPQIDFNKVKIDDYEVIEATPPQKKKCKQFRAIIDKIEKQKPKKVKLPDFGPEYKTDYKKELNEKQLEAVVTTKGPVLVIAGAGTGKTHLLAYRTNYLIESGVDPAEILLLTFTRKAAKEMIGRVNEMRYDNFNTEVSGGTFHSTALNIMRQYPDYFNLASNFTIADSSRSMAVMDLARTELKLDQLEKEFPGRKRLLEIISLARNIQVSIQEVIDEKFTGLKDMASDIQTLFDWYQEFKQSANIIDFDDMMVMLRDTLRDDEDFRKIIQDKYEYIMVDEYQDTNVVQKELVDLMVNKNRNLMVVGDDAQCIYTFRGTSVDNILRFADDYDDCQIIKLEVNHRSTQKILDFTNSVNNSFKLGYKKMLKAFRTWKGKKVKVLKFFNRDEEAKFIADKIHELHEKDIPYKEMAVLCRSAWFWQKVELELNTRKIPYVTVGGKKFIEKEHIQDMMAYLTVVQNPLDAVAWHHILKLETGVGKVTAGKIVPAISENDGMLDTLVDNEDYPKPVCKLLKLIDGLDPETKSLADIFSTVNAYYKPILEQKDEESDKSIRDITVVEQMCDNYDNLGEFLGDFSLDPFDQKFVTDIRASKDEREEEPVTLSTIHSAKGLEWGNVFIPHALDGMFPSSKAMHNIEELEEEHRVFYVGASRAKDRLFITMPSSFKTEKVFYSLPSRFLVQVDKNTFSYGEKKERRSYVKKSL